MAWTVGALAFAAGSYALFSAGIWVGGIVLALLAALLLVFVFYREPGSHKRHDKPPARNLKRTRGR
ncbi:hypothetical protein DMH04_21485 [Kibdelosporangium aridum]|uniref:Uncharacterized protein n=1 Tax=Kibdelosporangium aridum TaxID=2030 RepID=A0A428Z8E3_KIBAR|nr:hypothetical protein DMH04_21485 [Kibdelosporangium aridum]